MIARVFTALTLFVIACTLFLVFSRHREGYGLDDLFAGQRLGAPEKLTKPEAAPVSASEVPGLTRLNQEVTTLINAVAPAVVSINTNRVITRRAIDFFGRSRFYQNYVPGLGSGVIISKEGHVVTNFHVIEHADEITAVLHDGSVCLLKKIGEDRNADIALLQIQDPRSREFHAIPFADSDRVQVGETVFAIGNPFGLRESVTQGIINHRDRRLSDSDPPKFQTDAVINPGNSGGPLINVRGEIVGINVAIYAGQEEVRVWQGIGLAIAANDVVRSVERIRDGGREKTGYLGVQAESQQTDDNTEELILTDVTPGSPADKAGLKPGDVVLKFGGLPVTKGFDLFSRINRRPIDQPVDLLIRRGDTEMTLTAVVADREAMLTQEEKTAERRDLREQIGIEVQNFTESQRRQFPREIGGIVVTAVEPGSPADGQLFRGAVIYEVDNVRIDSVEKFFSIISTLKGKKFALRFIWRGQAWSANIELPT
ncbi:MAG: trypsin-like peptidase domain-containing protein [Verrucomicrobiales bacterium]